MDHATSHGVSENEIEQALSHAVELRRSKHHGMGGHMTRDPTADMTEAELVAYYQAHRGDTEEWEPAAAIRRPARLDVTISVRFTAEEIAGVRERARDAGMRPTAFIRQAALDVDVPLNRGLLAKTVDRLRSHVEQLASIISIEEVHSAAPRSGAATTPRRPRSKRTTARAQPSVSAGKTSKQAEGSDAADK